MLAAAMNPQVELNLALILFVPWFSILAWLYWAYPKQPRLAARTLFDSGALLLATLLAGWGMHWSMHNADPNAGAIWKQVLATSVAYGLFRVVMTPALRLRLRRLPRGRAAAPGARARSGGVAQIRSAARGARPAVAAAGRSRPRGATDR